MDAETEVVAPDLMRLAIARADITAALEMADLAVQMEPRDDPVFWAFQNAVIVAYGRPFTFNKPIGKLKPPEWPGYESEHLHAQHATIMKLRHQVVAHAQTEHRAVRVIPPGFDMSQIPRPEPIPLERLSYKNDETPGDGIARSLTIAVERPAMADRTGSYQAVQLLCRDLLPRLSAAITTEFTKLGLDGYRGPTLRLVAVAPDAPELPSDVRV
jgi:hypothetical protein